MSDHRVEQLKKEFLQLNNYNMPITCTECGGLMVFKGVGEYECEVCGRLDYDDYGKARNYIEKHGTATVAQVADATGVTQKSIRDMLKESRLEIAANSNAFLQCEMCGANIRSGRFCAKCEMTYHRNFEERMRKNGNIMAGFGTEKPAGEEGLKRFIRDK